MSAAAEVQALHRLADRLGVQRSYVDLAGRRQDASTAALLQITAALDGGFAELREAPEALRRRLETDQQRVLEPVVASFGRAAPRLPLQLAAPAAVPRVLVQSEGDADYRELQPVRLLGHARGCSLLLPPMPLGYHRLRLQIGGHTHETLLVRAPQRLAPMSPGGLGMFLPLHALRQDDDLGVGSYSGLARLAQWCGEHGGRVLSTLPLLATNLDEPFEYSPYSPLSRCFWNEVFLDVAAAPGLADCEPARRALAAIEAPAAALRRQPLVDYRAAVAMVRSVLQPLAQWTAAAATPLGDSFRSFRRDPEVERYARFRAVLAARGEPWQHWPEPMRRGELPDGSFDAQLATYHAYTQWLAGRQLDAARADADAAGVALYLDLPLGVHPAGFDTFRHQGLFVAGAAAGAPPDPLFSKGQNWGFPPLHPERQRQQGYGHMIAVLRHHLRCARILRLDHVMGLHRLYYVADGMPATAGLYVHYPAEELFAVVCLEAARAGCHVVGEDLGTVPPVVRERMHRHGLGRLHVLQHSIAPQQQPPVQPAPAGSVASLNTHDMPTFAGFLACSDLRDQLQMGLLDDAGLAAATAERERNIAALIAHLQQRGLVGDSPGPQQVMRGAQLLLAAGDSELLLLNLEDLWLEPSPQNVPGTWRERPNWLRRAAVSFDSLRRLPEVHELLAALILARRNRSPRMKKKSPRSQAARPPVATPPAAPATAAPATVAVAAPQRVRGADGVEYLSLLSNDDLHLFNEGSHFRLYRHFGAHCLLVDGRRGCHFAVWAPNAAEVSVIGSFNDWQIGAAPLHARANSGIWEGFVPGVEPAARYKFHIRARNGYEVDKADPFAFRGEVMPATASIVVDLDYDWGDQAWMRERRVANSLQQPISIYEVHLGSWRRSPETPELPLGFRELAPLLVEHLRTLQFTHVELMPITEHPFYGSWGYQVTGYFAATSRYGTPQDLMFLIDTLHQAGFGVILDWVPSHFPRDEAGLGYFDGTHLYEHEDPRQGRHPDWDSLIFNYGRDEVRSFLISSAMFWLDLYHADGLRVDGVASMLYLDFSRREGEWVPNVHGGRENLGAIALLRRLNDTIQQQYPDVQSIAEDSTSWPMVTRPSHLGGLGFGLKWDLGWMNDVLRYLATDPIYRSYAHGMITFRNLYAFHENFVLPLSHDEVVHGKGSLLGKMPGDDWQKFANLRLLLAMMFGNPGKKLLFMGSELAQRAEWNHDHSLDWHLLADPRHGGVQRLVGDLNRLYRATRALYELDTSPDGFEWLDAHDSQQSCYTMLRKDRQGGRMLVAWNCTPVPRHNYRIGVDEPGVWREVLNTDATIYGGSGQGNLGEVEAGPVRHLQRPCSLNLVLPPLAGVFLELQP